MDFLTPEIDNEKNFMLRFLIPKRFCKNFENPNLLNFELEWYTRYFLFRENLNESFEKMN